jgi:hypothetical protein
MKSLLEPSGVLVLIFQPETQWIAGRLSRMVAATSAARRSSSRWNEQQASGGRPAPGRGRPRRRREGAARAEADAGIRSRLLEMGKVSRHARHDRRLAVPVLAVARRARYHLLVGLACLALACCCAEPSSGRGSRWTERCSCSAWASCCWRSQA